MKVSNKFDLCYYGQVNSLRLKLRVALKWASEDWTALGVTFILLAMEHLFVHKLQSKNYNSKQIWKTPFLNMHAWN